jgi:hypothetical protein
MGRRSHGQQRYLPRNHNLDGYSLTSFASSETAVIQRRPMPEIDFSSENSGPELTASGRLRELEGKLLFGQPYPLSVTARGPRAGVRRIEILMDGQRAAVWECDCPGDPSKTVTWSFDPTPATVGDGPHEITVRAVDCLDKVASVAWTVIKSEYADRTEDEILQDSLEFRPVFGLSTDPTHIDRVMHDAAHESNWEFFDVPLTDEEVTAADLLNEDVSRPWDGVVIADGWPWPGSSSTSEAQPEQRGGDASAPTDPVERYGATEAAGVYAGSYIGDGAIKVGFTRDGARHLEQLRSRTAKPLALFEATFSLVYLRSLQARVSDDVQELDAAGIRLTEVGVDVPQNIVIVGTKPITAAQRQELLDRYGPAIRLTTPSR